MIRRVLATPSLAKRTARSQDDFFNGLLAPADRFWTLEAYDNWAHRVAAEVTSADQALDVYRYIGLVIQRTGAFKAKQFAGAS